MRREIERFGERVVVHLELVLRRPAARHLERVAIGDRRQAHDLEEPRDPRPLLDDELVRERVDLADDDRVARLDEGEQRVEDPARALHVLAGPERFLEAREDPDDLAPRGPADDVLHALFEHADERLAGVHVRGTRLECEPPAFEPANRFEDQRRLARARVADEQHRAWLRRVERGRDGVDRDRPGADDRGRRLFVRLEHAAELLEEGDVDEGATPLLHRGLEGGSRLLAPGTEDLVDDRLKPHVELAELFAGDGLAGRDSGVEERGDLLDDRGAAPVLLRLAQDLQHEPALAHCKCAQEELALAPLGAPEAAGRPLRPVARRRTAGSDRFERAHAEVLARGARRVGEGAVGHAILAAEELDEPLEVLVGVEQVRVEPGMTLGERLHDRADLLGPRLVPPSHHPKLILLLH